ncbi:winged helix-turn-helix domain-containing protein [Paenibacillus sp. FSL L8-0641]|uniref:winged helix-turn-helix domain-containing protein n=1 Tax=Paenibacillus sp. FSL L8-0641 TaxID=2921605 RepID=UPI0030F8B887
MDLGRSSSLSVTIKRLRDKLENLPSCPQYIKTYMGSAYTWAVKNDSPELCVYWRCRYYFILCWGCHSYIS